MSDGTFAGLKGWGLTVATTDPNSIKNTSVISPYMAKGSCN
jgi:mannan endo-1,4-beta-mannosidase